MYGLRFWNKIFRDKLYSSLEKYVQESERSNLSKTCDEIEDWLYGDGEDQPKSKYPYLPWFNAEMYHSNVLLWISGVIKHVSDVYVERKTNLDAAVAPVRHRAIEHENRQSSLNKLTDTLNFYQKVHISYIYTGHLLIAKQFSRFKSAFCDHSGTSFFPNSSFNRPLYL